MNELREIGSFLRNDWRTFLIDLLLGLIVLGIVCAWSWKFAVIAFVMLSYIAGGSVLLIAALFIGFRIKEKIDAFFT